MSKHITDKELHEQMSLIFLKRLKDAFGEINKITAALEAKGIIPKSYEEYPDYTYNDKYDHDIHLIIQDTDKWFDKINDDLKIALGIYELMYKKKGENDKDGN